MLPLWEETKPILRIARLTQEEEVETLMRLFEGVAEAEGWQPEGALRHFQDHSVYFALEVEGQLAGGLQLVLPDASQRLPCQNLWSEVTVGPANRCAHVAILALKEQFRGRSFLFWHLVVEMWRHCVREGIVRLFIEVTPRVLPLYQRLGWPLQIQGELRRHWGEDCYLCTLSIPEVAEALLRRAEHSSYYQQIIAQAFRVTFSRGSLATMGG